MENENIVERALNRMMPAEVDTQRKINELLE